MRLLIAGKEPNGRSALAIVLATRKDTEAFDSAENISEKLDKLEKDEYDVVRLNRPSHKMSEFERPVEKTRPPNACSCKRHCTPPTLHRSDR